MNTAYEKKAYTSTLNASNFRIEIEFSVQKIKATTSDFMGDGHRLVIISFENLSLKCYTFKTSYRSNHFFHQRKVLSLPKPEALGRRATNLRHIVIGKCIIGMSFLMTFHVTLETILCTESLLTAITGTEERFLPYRQQKPDIRNIQAYIRYC